MKKHPSDFLKVRAAVRISCISGLTMVVVSCMPVKERKSVEASASRPETLTASFDLAPNDADCRSIGLGRAQAHLTSHSDLASKADVFGKIAAKAVGAPPGALTIKTASYERLRQDPSEGSGLINSQITEVSRFSYQIAGIPLCRKEILIHRTGNAFKTIGSIPQLTGEAVEHVHQQLAELVWPEVDEALGQRLCQHLKKRGWVKGCPAAIESEEGPRRCFSLSTNKAETARVDGVASQINVYPYLEVNFRADEQPYFAVIGHQGLLSDQSGDILEKRSFSIGGHGQVFERTSDGSFRTKSVAFDHLGGSGYLCGPRFTAGLIFSSSADFSFPPTAYPGPAGPILDFRKYEATAFYNARTYSSWVRSITTATSWNGEYSGWPGPQIHIRIDASRGGSNNTAVYYPKGKSGLPTIALGNGDNDQLRNLLPDPEVISHELGHHLAYRYLTSTRGQSLDLHEGMADALVYYQTGNSCLAETICPSTKVCVSRKCLRTGENNLTYLSTLNMKSGHKKSQLISGLLWDIGKRIGNQQAAALLIRSFSFLTASADYAGLIVALQQADSSLFRGKYYCSAIKPLLMSRRFDPLLPADHCPGTGI